MRIKITEIEADARELRESNTLATNFAMMLSRAFQNREPLDDEEEGLIQLCAPSIMSEWHNVWPVS